MAPKKKPERQRQKHYFKAWREKLGITQDTAVNRLGWGWTQSKLSRIENGITPYDQNDLEMLEEAYGVSKESLLGVDPTKEGEVVDLVGLIRQMTEDEKRAAIKAIQFSLELKRGA